MKKGRARKHEVQKVSPGRAAGASHERTAQGRGGAGGYHVETEVHEDGEMRGYQALWRAVFAQQLMDAKSRSSKSDARYNRGQALHWLFDNEHDFNMVCDFAGLDPETTRRKVLAAQDRDFRWNKRKPQLNRIEIEERGRASVRALFDLDLLPLLYAPPRAAKRRTLAESELGERQLEWAF